MTERTIKMPGPDHPITIERNDKRFGPLESISEPQFRKRFDVGVAPSFRVQSRCQKLFAAILKDDLFRSR